MPVLGGAVVPPRLAPAGLLAPGSRRVAFRDVRALQAWADARGLYCRSDRQDGLVRDGLAVFPKEEGRATPVGRALRRPVAAAGGRALGARDALALRAGAAAPALSQGAGAENQESGVGSQQSEADGLEMRRVGADPVAPAVGLDRQAGVSNYCVGNSPSQRVTNVPHSGRVEYQAVYPGIDLVS
jgi:hypothetical protein